MFILTTIANVISSFVYPKHAHKIIDRLWLGDYLSALDIKFLKKNKVNLIVNCTPDMPIIDNQTADELNIQTIRLSVEDSLLERDLLLMEEYLKSVLPFLVNSYKDNNKNILIHCHQGKQRSAIVVMALLKSLYDNNVVIPGLMDSDFDSIYNFLLKRRPQVFTFGFRVNFKNTFLRYFNYL